ncbi:hypothetical protein CBR_g39376 [Chara braunii]|uniref:ACB domain-containing protein n=1 Tax=Chara braunii TaxID=69332 RepID=A0A388LRN3_CHABU|nr:hypothetical protein CBR_g39376 [Chara braunii]|eukprot:GBG84915.1 hypothetical protein CBR_g39376 [Chara braunii]
MHADLEVIVPNIVFGIIFAWMVQRVIQVIVSFRENNLKLQWPKEGEVEMEMEELVGEGEALEEENNEGEKMGVEKSYRTPSPSPSASPSPSPSPSLSPVASQSVAKVLKTDGEGEGEGEGDGDGGVHVDFDRIRRGVEGEVEEDDGDDDDDDDEDDDLDDDDDEDEEEDEDDDDDDDEEGEGRGNLSRRSRKRKSEIEDLFDAAATYVAAMVRGPGIEASQETQLLLYGLFKQASFGPCNIPKPSIYSVAERAKWDAWNKLGDMKEEEAMAKYVDVLTLVNSGWRSLVAAREASVGQSSQGDHGGRRSMGPVFSTLQDEDSTEYESLEMAAIHEMASEGNLEGVLAELAKGVAVNLPDEKKRTPLHWAADRGHLDVVKLLLARGASTNLQDSTGQTPLHYAVLCEFEEVAKALWEHDADPFVKDEDGTTPDEMMPETWHWRTSRI